MSADQHARNVSVVRGLLERTGNADLSAMLGLDEEFRHTAPEPQLRRTPGLRPRPIYHGNS
jgi:hypothetical protein